MTDEIVVHRLMTHGGFGLFATLFRETLVPCPSLTSLPCRRAVSTISLLLLLLLRLRLRHCRSLGSSLTSLTVRAVASLRTCSSPYAREHVA